MTGVDPHGARTPQDIPDNTLVEPRTVWAVSTGEYSDYAVHAVYEDEADARRAAERVHGDVSPMALMPPGDDSLRYVRRATGYASVTRAGCEFAFSVWDPSEVVSLDVADVVVAAVQLSGDFYYVNVSADTKERAERALRERVDAVRWCLSQGGDPLQLEWNARP